MLFNLDNKMMFFDGAMGTMLQKRGLKPGDLPDLMNISAPDAVQEIHKLYIEAGSDIISTNTFGANAFTLRETNYTPEDIISAAVSNAKSAIHEAKLIDATRVETIVALDIGPIGELLEPVGDLEIQQAKEMFVQQAIAGEKAGADLIVIETMSDINEIEVAIKAAKENTKLPVFATMTFNKNGRTFMGADVESFVRLAEALGVTALGMNCSLEPKDMYPVAVEFAKIAKLPLIFKLNAGLPDGKTGEYSVDPKEFAEQFLPFADLGMKIVGGCCGTSPEYIKELRKAFG